MILVTGGAGYIGSHTILELLTANYDVVVLDNLSNASFEALRRVEHITGKPVTFVQGDVRDYIHVVDLAKGHVAALQSMSGCKIYNLGTGQGTSVFELMAAFEPVTGVTIPYDVAARRAGDLATCYASVVAAEQELGWHATKNIDDMVADTWRWQSQNPLGYKNEHN